MALPKYIEKTLFKEFKKLLKTKKLKTKNKKQKNKMVKYKKLLLSDISSFLNELITEERLSNLLKKEKERKGIPEDKLLFLGIADIASYYWCGMKSFLKLKEYEINFFGAYLQDRIYYSYELGKLKKFPKEEEILDIGNDITFEEIEYLLKKRRKEFEKYVKLALPINKINDIEAIYKKEQELFWEKTTEPKIVLYYDKKVYEKNPLERGSIYHWEKAEKYPTIRWSFLWDRYVVLGVPDGITDTFVYEFKTSKHEKGYMMKYLKPVAFTQGDLYGMFFKRPKKRIQLYSEKDDEILTFQEPVNIERAISALKGIKEIEEGILPKPPKEWKCKVCEYKNKCPLIKL